MTTPISKNPSPNTLKKDSLENIKFFIETLISSSNNNFTRIQALVEVKDYLEWEISQIK